MTHYVFSTLSSPQVYTRTKPGGGDLPKTVAAVRIEGGANVPDKHMITPRGVMTTVTDEELTVLQENRVFQLHVKNGYITVEAKKTDPEKAAANMATRSPDAPLVEADFKEGEKPVETKPSRKA